MVKVLFVGFRDPFHSAAGGYDKITGYPNSDILLDKDVALGFIPMHKSGKVLNTFCLDLVARMRRRKYDVTHYFYGDMLIFPFKSNKKHKVVATIHQDVKQRHRNSEMFKKTLKSLDGVVCLSSAQQKLLQDEFGVHSVFIPHGFEKPVFDHVANMVDKSKINVVIIGSNYRDIETMKLAIDYCRISCSGIFFHLLGQPAHIKELFSEYGNAKCYSRLNDNEYYSLISDCDYNFLPLTFATANNALLEAQFLGVTSILPQMEGIDDYAAPGPLNLFYKSNDDLQKVFSALEQKSNNRDLQLFAERFLWSNIYPQLKNFYNKL